MLFFYERNHINNPKAGGSGEAETSSSGCGKGAFDGGGSTGNTDKCIDGLRAYTGRKVICHLRLPVEGEGIVVRARQYRCLDGNLAWRVMDYAGPGG